MNKILMPKRALSKKPIALLLACAFSPIAANAAESLLNMGVSENGVYRISHGQLASYGLDISGQAVNKLRLVSAGEEVPIWVTGSTANSSVFGVGSTITFVGESVNTLYTDENMYTLEIADGVHKRIAADRTAIGGENITASYLAKKSYAPQKEYSFISPDANDPWYAERMLSFGDDKASKSVILELDHYVPGGNKGSTKARLSVNVWGASDGPGLNDHDVSVKFNNQEVVSDTFNGIQGRNLKTELDNLRPGNNQVKVDLPMKSGQAFDLVNLNEIALQYPRGFVADGEQLQFDSAGHKFVVQGFANKDIEVYRQDDSGVSVMTQTRKGGRCNAANHGCAVMFDGLGEEAKYLAITTRSIKSPALHALAIEDDIKSGDAEYLIISHPDFIEANNSPLQPFAADLLGEFGSVDIVNVENVYEDFGDSIFGASAIQNYIKYSAENRGTKMVLLVGGDVYDYKKFKQENARSFIPSIYASTDGTVNFAPVDAKYVDFDDDNVPDLPIGRLPVRTVQELTTLLNKRSQYLARSYTGKALFAADSYDHIQQYDFSSDADAMSGEHFSTWDVEKAYVDTNGVQSARQTVVDSINEGQSLTAFFGHSSTNQWSFSGLFTGNDAASLSNAGKPTVVTQWGCWNTYYVSPDDDSMGHRFMVEGDRGAVAVMGATTITQAATEKALAELVLSRISQGERLGDAITNAKQEYALTNPDDLDVLLGWSLLGTPELAVY